MAIEIIDPTLNIALQYGSELHQKILSRLTARQKMSEANMSKRYDAWDQTDEHCRMYINLARKAKNADGTTNQNKREMPWDRSIVVPVSYAILMVYMWQLMAIFMRRDPMIEVDGVGPEDILTAKVMDAVLAYDQRESRYPLHLFSFAQDSVKYGIGVETDSWEDNYGWKFQMRPPTPYDDMLDAMPPEMLQALGIPPKIQRDWDLIKQYNKIESVDPFMFWPDPRTSMSDIEGMEFVGHRVWKSYLSLLAMSQENGGPYFNIESVKKLGPGNSGPLLRSRNRFQTSHLLLTGSTDEDDAGFHAVDTFKVKIVPAAWGLSGETRPEIWHFTMVDLQVIIRAHRYDAMHGQYNYSVTESNCDPHVALNPGVIENLDGLQRFINWGYNSHKQNVIRHLNNSMGYAPSLVEQLDILHPQPAGHFRMSALGEKLLMEGRITMDQVFHQINKVDVTKGMMQDVQFEYDMAMRMTGAADQFQGVNPTQNRTLGENQQVVAGGGGRMAFHAGMMEIMAIRSMALRLIANRQQYTDMPQYYRIGGDLVRQLGMNIDRLMIGRQDLQGNFDYIAKTGPTPPTDQEMAMAWLKAGELLAANPVLFTMPDAEGMVLDPVGISKEVLRQGLHIRNVDSFRMPLQAAQMRNMAMAGPPEVVDDEKIEKEKKAGNIIPMNRAA